MEQIYINNPRGYDQGILSQIVQIGNDFDIIEEDKFQTLSPMDMSILVGICTGLLEKGDLVAEEIAFIDTVESWLWEKRQPVSALDESRRVLPSTEQASYLAELIRLKTARQHYDSLMELFEVGSDISGDDEVEETENKIIIHLDVSDIVMQQSLLATYIELRSRGVEHNIVNALGDRLETPIAGDYNGNLYRSSRKVIIDSLYSGGTVEDISSFVFRQIDSMLVKADIAHMLPDAQGQNEHSTRMAYNAALSGAISSVREWALTQVHGDWMLDYIDFAENLPDKWKKSAFSADMVSKCVDAGYGEQARGMGEFLIARFLSKGFDGMTGPDVDEYFELLTLLHGESAIAESIIKPNELFGNVDSFVRPNVAKYYMKFLLELGGNLHDIDSIYNYSLSAIQSHPDYSDEAKAMHEIVLRSFYLSAALDLDPTVVLEGSRELDIAGRRRIAEKVFGDNIKLPNNQAIGILLNSLGNLDGDNDRQKYKNLHLRVLAANYLFSEGKTELYRIWMGRLSLAEISAVAFMQVNGRKVRW